MVEKNQLRRYRCGGPANLFQLSFANQSSGIRTVTVLKKLANDIGARASCQRSQFFQRFFCAELRHGKRFRARGNAGGSVTRGLRLRRAQSLRGFFATDAFRWRYSSPIRKARSAGVPEVLPA